MTLPAGIRPVERVWPVRILAALVGCAILLAFFYPALARYGSAYYAPAGITQTHSLTRMETGVVPENELLSDVAVQMHPWLMFNKSELAAGRLPLWNPYNGGGSPHLANGQSAVFSPFSLPFYAMPFRAALLVTAALKLAVLGLFTYLFLRRLGLFAIPSGFGALTFAFSGHNLLLLGYPHVAAAAVLPAGLYFIEVAFQRFDSDKRPAPWALAGLCLTMATGLLAGQPEPCFFAMAMLGLYTVARGVVSWRRAGGTWQVARSLVPGMLHILAAALIAIGLGAFQTVPFLEYMFNSRLFEQRSAIQTPLLSLTWPLHFFPNLLGNPSESSHYLHPAVPPPNFETANLVYAGAMALLLAAVSLVFARRNWAHGFFAFVALLWLAYGYDILGTGRLLGMIPGLHIAPINRSQILWLFAVACCAAFGLQNALSAERRRVGVCVFAVALGFGALLVFRQAAIDLLPRAHTFINQLMGQRQFDAGESTRAARAHMDEMSVIFGLGVLMAGALWIAPRGMVRVSLALGLMVFGYLGTGNLFKEYNPLCENRHFYPVTESVQQLQKHVGSDRLVIIGQDTLPPDTNMVYGLSMISSYDGLWVGRYDRLFRAMFGESTNWRNIEYGTTRGLRLFGADWVLSKDEWIPIGTLLPGVRRSFDPLFKLGELRPGVQVRQSFTVAMPRLQAIQIFATTEGREVDSVISWTLEDRDSREVIANGIVQCSELTSAPDEMKPAILRLDAPYNPKRRAMLLRLSADVTTPKNAISLWASRGLAPEIDAALWRTSQLRDLRPAAAIHDKPQHPELSDWYLERGNTGLEGTLCMDLSSSLSDFQVVESLAPFDLFRFKRGLGRWHAVSDALFAKSEESAFALVQHPGLDVGRTVVLEGVDGTEVEEETSDFHEDSPVEVLRDLPTSQRLFIERQRPGWLVLTQPWYPGWYAHVNGVSRPILRANYAFGAVRLDAGSNLVELDYRPRSFRFGLWITLLSFLAGAGLFSWLTIVPRLRSRSVAA